MATSGRRLACVVVGVAGVLGLAPSSSAAEAIHVLMLMPRAAGPVSQQVESVERALFGLRGSLVVVESLADADAIVQLREHRRTAEENGDQRHEWTGSFKLLAPPSRRAGFQPPTPERFTMVFKGPEEDGALFAAKALTRMLMQALGRQDRPRPEQTI